MMVDELHWTGLDWTSTLRHPLCGGEVGVPRSP
jgi:hypothetical protein